MRDHDSGLCSSECGFVLVSRNLHTCKRKFDTTLDCQFTGSGRQARSRPGPRQPAIHQRSIPGSAGALSHTIARLLLTAVVCVALAACARQIREAPPLAAAGATTTAAHDPAMDAQVAQLADEWARIKYQVNDKSSQFHHLDEIGREHA